MPPVYDQKTIGSCTANAVVAQSQFLDGEFLSRLFLYYETRRLEGTVADDSGCVIRDVYKVLAKAGACLEKHWPYLPAKYATRPTASAYLEAKRHQALAYHSVLQDSHAIREALASGLPVAFGFTVFSGFESEEVRKTGIANLPTSKEKELGGHAVVLVGYDDAAQRFLVRNSWGEKWGQNGYFTMPYEYVLRPDLSSDFWVLTNVE
jgi:C1A family cysteine protease